MHHGLRMGEQQAPYRIDILHTVTVDTIGIPQQMNGQFAAAVRLQDGGDMLLQEVLHHAEIATLARIVKRGISLQVARVQGGG